MWQLDMALRGVPAIHSNRTAVSYTDGALSDKHLGQA
jgi:hypothetical protein